MVEIGSRGSKPLRIFLLIGTIFRAAREGAVRFLIAFAVTICFRRMLDDRFTASLTALTREGIVRT